MARDYAALPHEYLDEMGCLSDAEYGRLCRALQKYSANGTPIELSGNERFFAKRVMNREDRYQEQFKQTDEARSKAGKKGMAARWGNKNNSNNSGMDVITNDNKNNYTETKAKTKAEAERKETTTTSSQRKSGCAAVVGVVDSSRSEAAKAVISDYLNRVNSSAPQRNLDILAGYAEHMGAEVCKRAFDIALGERKPQWSYIHGILKNYMADGVTCLADVDAREAKRSKCTARFEGVRNITKQPESYAELAERMEREGRI